MNLIDFNTNEKFTFSDLRCKLLMDEKFSGDKKIISGPGRVLPIEENHYKLVMENQVYEFAVSDPYDAAALADRMKQRFYNLAYVKTLINDPNIFFLHISFFYTVKREIRQNIILSKRVRETLEKKHLVTGKKDFEEEVKGNFVLSDGTNHCYAYTSGKYKLTDEDADGRMPPAEEGNLADDPADTPEHLKSMKIYGKEYAITVRLKGKEEEMFLYAESVDTRNRSIPSMALWIGELSFKDEKVYVSEKVKKELEITKGYLDIWDMYTRMEGDFLLKRAREAGLITIGRDKINKGEGGLIVYPQDLSNKQRRLIAAGDYLFISENIPMYIEDVDMTWAEYRKYLFSLKKMKIRPGENHIRKIMRIDRSGYWVIEAGETDSLPAGIITYSIFGNMQQIIRRETAREMIENGKAALPSLGLVIEGKQPECVPEVRIPKKIEPITPLVREKIFRHEPRSRQRDAIEIALNTPDIAIIQGPPGTGKTTVITAVIERLNEIADKRGNNSGRVLITSFQHDAVRNVIGRLSINSLPTIKFGRQGDDDISQEKAIEEWCSDYARRLKGRNPSISRTVEQKQLERRHERYLISPNDTNARMFLNLAKRINADQSIDEEIDRILEEIDLDESDISSKLLEKIRRIRTTRAGFMDDGPDTADDLLAELEDHMKAGMEDNDDIFVILEEAADCLPGDIGDSLLLSLKEVKQKLLERCMPRPSYRIEKPRADILNLYTRLFKMLRRPGNEEDEILYHLLDELESNTSEIEDTIAGYNFVYAATAQQSEGKDIRRAKNIEKWEHPVYDTVIIDEAARVNPGDLMIPMAQAGRRIILVGDHRQLPHIYDEEIFENLRDSGNEVGKEAVRISMFEYLREKAEQLCRMDGIPRTITLDAQYRMHPELGGFINRNFYEPYGEGFESPLGAEHFAQKLSRKPYLWVSMPNSSGDEEKVGTSRMRMCEAVYIVNKLREYILSEEGRRLSYGVITFYSAQAKLIRQLLSGKDISEMVRVGSVDAFQGMEFDVIFLSVVRTYAGIPDYDQELLNRDVSSLDEEQKSYREWQDYRDTVGMRNYGFLTSENRLCVALSRQKRLLIVVGDPDIFHLGGWGDLAEKCVPAMKNLYELCEREGAVLNA